MRLPSLRNMLRSRHRKWWNIYFLIISPLTLLFITSSTISSLRHQIPPLIPPPPTISSLRPQILPLIPPPPTLTTPYHNWEIFNADYQQMLKKLKIYVYPDAFSSNKSKSSPTAAVFLPNPDPFNPKTGNYYSEHAFKLALLRSSLVTDRPGEADFFFMPFSINVMRYHPLVRSGSTISDFVASYVSRISSDSGHWNASGGADHFFVCCHSVGRDATSKHQELHNNAIQITCSSSYFQRLYTPHKDVALPQVWPRPDIGAPDPPHRRSVADPNGLVVFGMMELEI